MLRKLKLQFLGVGGVGMMTFVACAHLWDATQLMRCSCTHVTDGVGLGGWGGDDDAPCMCTPVRCYSTDALLLHRCWMLCNWWGGVGMMTFLACAHRWDATQLMRCSCTHVECYATDGVGWGWWRSLHVHTCEMLRNWCLALAHMLDATQLVGWGGDDDVPCMCTPVRCYATDALLLHRCWMLRNWWGRWWWWRSLHVHTCEMLHNWCVALAHMLDATQLVGWGGVGVMTFLACAHLWGATQLMPCSCTHVGCYATDWVGLGGGVVMMTFLACAHLWGATQLMPCSCTHVGCYATDWVGLGGGVVMMTFLACAHLWDATQLMRCPHMLDATQLMGWVGGSHFLLLVITQSFGQWRSKIRIRNCSLWYLQYGQCYPNHSESLL